MARIWLPASVGLLAWIVLPVPAPAEEAPDADVSPIQFNQAMRAVANAQAQQANPAPAPGS